MLCQKCNKNTANVHIVKLVNGEKNELWVCDECARELSGSPINLNKNSDVAEQFQDMLGTFFQAIGNNEVKNNSSKKKEAKNIVKDEFKIDIICKNCGMTYSEFKKNRKFGCAECYSSFMDIGKDVINKDNKEHIGKIPLSIEEHFENRRRINSLKKLIKDCINKEEYEKAAEIRDEIREIENRYYKEKSYEELDR